MAEVVQHPVLDRFSIIHVAALELGLQEQIDRRAGDRIKSSFSSWQNAPEGVSKLDLVDVALGKSFHFSFAPPEGEPNPMRLSIIDDETFEGSVEPVLAHLAVHSLGVIEFPVENKPSNVSAYQAFITAGATILAPEGREVAHDPFIGEYDGKEYKAADEILTRTTPINSLTKIAVLLDRPVTGQ